MKGDFSKGDFSTERNIKIRKYTDETEQVVLPEGRSQKWAVKNTGILE